MASKKDKKVAMVSTGETAKGKKTGYIKTTTNSNTEKLVLYKYDPFAFNEKTGRNGKKVKFVQKKIKS